MFKVRVPFKVERSTKKSMTSERITRFWRDGYRATQYMLVRPLRRRAQYRGFYLHSLQSLFCEKPGKGHSECHSPANPCTPRCSGYTRKQEESIKIRVRFASIEERDSFLWEHFPVRESMAMPGLWRVPEFGGVAVMLEMVVLMPYKWRARKAGL